MNRLKQMDQGLKNIFQGRDLIPTLDYADQIGMKPQTVRKNYCQTGEAFGLRPIKIGNRLMWRVNDVAKLIEYGETKIKKTPTPFETEMSALSKRNFTTRGAR